MNEREEIDDRPSDSDESLMKAQLIDDHHSHAGGCKKKEKNKSSKGDRRGVWCKQVTSDAPHNTQADTNQGRSEKKVDATAPQNTNNHMTVEAGVVTCQTY